MDVCGDTKIQEPIKYPKIKTLFKRDPETFNVVVGEFALSEFEYLSRCYWQVNEKIDGTNIRVHWDGEGVHFYGRTSKSQIPVPLLASLRDLFPPEKFKGLDPLCLYGEGYGADIQKRGSNYLPDSTSFRVFDVRCGEWWLKTCDVEDVRKKLNILAAPLLYVNNLRGIELEVGNGFKSAIGTANAEGIVVRPTQQLFTRHGERVIAKLKTKDFNQG